jgi:DNA polymerase elongation subunit (family B)
MYDVYVYSWGSQVLEFVRDDNSFHKGYLSCFGTDVDGNIFQILFNNYYFTASVAFESDGDYPPPDDSDAVKFIAEVIRLHNNSVKSFKLGPKNVYKQELDKLIKIGHEKNVWQINILQKNNFPVFKVTQRTTTRDASKLINFFDFSVSTFSQLTSFFELFSLSKCRINGKQFTSLVNMVPSCQVQFLSRFDIPCSGWITFKTMQAEKVSCESKQIYDLECFEKQTFMRLIVDVNNSSNIKTSENQSKMPMMRVLSFDIETYSDDGSLPQGNNTKHAVFQISCVLSRGVGENTLMVIKRSSCQLQFPSISNIRTEMNDDDFETSVRTMFSKRNCKDIEIFMNGTLFIASEEEVLLNLSQIECVKTRIDFQKYLFTIGRGLLAIIQISTVSDCDVADVIVDDENATSDDDSTDDEASIHEDNFMCFKKMLNALLPVKMSCVQKDDSTVHVRFSSSLSLKSFSEKFHGKIVSFNGKKFRLNVKSETNSNFDSFHFVAQQQLIEGFVTFIKRTNPHVLIGYNIMQYDLKFIHEKASSLNVQSWNKIGVSQDPVHFNEKYSSSNQKGDQKIMTVSNLNRVIVDMRLFLESEVKMDSYKLDSVANAYLGEKKDDLSAAGIFDAFKSFMDNADNSDEKMEICGSYCVQDSVLVTKLFIKFNTWIKLQEMSRASHTTIDQILQSGQLKRSHNCFYAIGAKNGIGFIPCQIQKNTDDASKYQGATVFKPVSGKYSKVISLDFASLYPSIMIAFNLCVSTMKNKWSPGCITVAIGNHKNCDCKRKSYVDLFEKNEDPEKTPKPGIDSSCIEHHDQNISSFKSFLSVLLERFNHFKKHPDVTFVHVKSFSDRCKTNAVVCKIKQMKLFVLENLDRGDAIELLGQWKNLIHKRRRRDEKFLKTISSTDEKFAHFYRIVIERRHVFDEEIFKIIDFLEKTTFTHESLIEKLSSLEKKFVYSDDDIKRVKTFKQLFDNEEKDKKIVCTDEKFYFDSEEQSVSSKVLTHLLNERKKAKKLLHEESLKSDANIFKIQMYDNLQNSFKVMANSVYGTFGASFNVFGSKAVAMCVTALGRFSNLSAAAEIKRMEGIIMYGDTDSNYVHFPVITVDNKKIPIENASDVEIAMFSKNVAERVSSMKCFKHPMKLEFENMIYNEILFVSKKRYVFSTVKDGKLEIKSKGLIGARRGLPSFDVSLFHQMETLVFDQTNRSVNDIVVILIDEILKLFQRQLTVFNENTNEKELDIKKLTFSKKSHVLEPFEKARVEQTKKQTKVMLGRYTVGAPKVDFNSMTEMEKQQFILNGLPEHVNVLYKCQYLRGEVVDSSRIEYVKLDMSTFRKRGKTIFAEKPLERRTAEDSKYFMENCQKIGMKLDLLKIIELVAKHMDEVLIKAFLRTHDVHFEEFDDMFLSRLQSMWPSINMHLSKFLDTLTSHHLMQGEINFFTYASSIKPDENDDDSSSMS